MKRLALALLLLALPLSAAEEKWWEAYNRGVKAVNARSYDAAAAALQKAIAQMPVENNAIRANRNDIITYVPHFWLGIARFNLGDVDAALREWKTSEEQGAIARTDYYPKLRDWVARAQTEKERSARSAATDSKKAADAALNRALNAQVEALTAGGDRTDGYRAANRKLQEALGVFNSAGSNIASYQRAESTAIEARELFRKSADEARRLKSARVAAPAPPPVAAAPQTVVSQPPPLQVVPKTKVVEAPAQTVIAAPTPAAGQAPARVAAPTIPAGASRAKAAAPPTLASVVVPQITPSASRAAARAQLEWAYRAFASGNLEASEQALTSLLGVGPSAEAFLLRGCTRFTVAMLSRKPEPLLDSARHDFRAALKANRALRLDKRFFSPKLVAFFDEVRKRG